MNKLLSRIKVTLRTEEQYLNVAMPPKKEVEPDIDVLSNRSLIMLSFNIFQFFFNYNR
jgi:hypothetical protein